MKFEHQSYEKEQTRQNILHSLKVRQNQETPEQNIKKRLQHDVLQIQSNYLFFDAGNQQTRHQQLTANEADEQVMWLQDLGHVQEQGT